MPSAVPFTLDAQFVPFVENLTVYTNSSAPVEVVIAGLGSTDVLAQAVLTAKVNPNDADSASTTIQKIISSVASPAGQITALGGGAYLLTFPLSASDEQTLLTSHVYSVQIWVNVGGATPAADPVVQTGTIVALKNLSGVTGILAPAGRVDLTPNPASVGIGLTTALTANVYDPSGQLMVGRACSWISSNPAVAQVDQNGVVTGVTAGTAVITATCGGVSDISTVTSAQAQDGSLGDFRGSIGDSSFGVMYDYLVNTTADAGGHVRTDDVRGVQVQPLSIFGHTNGANRPAWDSVAGEVSTDGSSNWLATAEDIVFDLGPTGTQVFYFITTANLAPTNGYVATIQKLDLSHFAGIQFGGDGKITLTYEGIVISSGIAPTNVLRLIILTFVGQPGTTGTLVNPLRSIEIPGRLRAVHNVDSNGTIPAGPKALVYGALWNSTNGGLAPSAERLRANGSIRRPLVAADMAALQRYAIRRGAILLQGQPSGAITEGDSRMVGFGMPAGNGPADRLATRLGAGWTVTNDGVPSRTLAEMVTMQPLFIATDNNALRAQNVYWLWGGVNPGADDAPTLLTRVTTAAAYARSLGYKVGIVKEIPTTPLATRNVLNPGIDALKTNGLIDYVAQIDARTELQDPNNATYFQVGTPHLTSLGYSIVGDEMATAMGF